MCCWAVLDMRVARSIRPHRLSLGDLDPTRFATPPVPREPKLGSERYPLVDPVRGLCTTIGQSILAGELCGLIVYASNPGAGYGNADAWLWHLAAARLARDN